MLSFTGERYILTESGEIRVEHFHRYAVARMLAQGKLVLDLACGEGYGSALLSSVALHVVGVDVADEAVDHARAAYGHLPNLKFKVGSAIQTGLSSDSVDMVVSFETIEHLAEQAEMMAEIRRVLKPEGILIISSPNRPVYSAGGNYQNEFHVKELDFAEFAALLMPHFDAVVYYGQRLAMGTVIQPLNQPISTYTAFTDIGDAVEQRSFEIQAPTYYLAVCGPTDMSLPSLNASIFFPQSLDLVEHYVGFANWAQNQDREIAIRDKNVLHYQKEANEIQLKALDLQRQLSAQETELHALLYQRQQLRKEIVRAQAQLELLKDLYLVTTSPAI